ncbi:MAG: glycoside hydrolase family protein [Myxococcales bacterium]|nr:glycoside hydrolase family protein [Myxococcales bacterium]
MQNPRAPALRRLGRLISAVLAACVVACGSGNGVLPLADGGGPGADGIDRDAGASSDVSLADSEGTAVADGSRTSDADAGSARDAGSNRDAGSSGESGAAPPDAGAATADGGAAPCKRGIAANQTPTAALVRDPSSAGRPAGAGVTWWYDWSTSPSNTVTLAGIEFVPMVWGAGSLGASVAASSFLLGFNEPNFKAQSNLTAVQAAADWPAVEATARAHGMAIVSPAVNFCGSASDPSRCSDPAVTSPYAWLKAFFAACPGCEVDAVAVHWYNCDLPSLQAYIEGSSSLEGFVQFGKPIWLTEFACDGSHSVADQKAYMQSAVPWLEANPHVQRYSWFSAGNIPNALLQNPDTSITDLGATYAAVPGACR